MITLLSDDIKLSMVTKGGNVMVYYKDSIYLMKGKTFNKIHNGIPTEAAISKIKIGEHWVDCFKTLTF